jgi:uncharacterized protein RhaS with RHS repeats
MYDPSIGRWLSQDPSGFEAGDPNLYRYCGNAPTDGMDPSGLAEYQVNNGTFDVAMTPGNNFVDVTIKFTPGKKCPEAGIIRFIQISKVTDKNGAPVDWTKAKKVIPSIFPGHPPEVVVGEEGEINQVRTTESKDSAGDKIAGGWNIDYLPSRIVNREFVLPFYDAYVKNPKAPDGTSPPSIGSNPPVKGKEYAQMWDRPQGQIARKFQFDTYVVCVNSPGGSLTVLGAISWGFTLADNGTPTLDKVEPHEGATATFKDALGIFNKHYLQTQFYLKPE